jgi:hypothetical protein
VPSNWTSKSATKAIPEPEHKYCTDEALDDFTELIKRKCSWVSFFIVARFSGFDAAFADHILGMHIGHVIVLLRSAHKWRWLGRGSVDNFPLIQLDKKVKQLQLSQRFRCRANSNNLHSSIVGETILLS